MTEVTMKDLVQQFTHFKDEAIEFATLPTNEQTISRLAELQRREREADSHA